VVCSLRSLLKVDLAVRCVESDALLLRCCCFPPLRSIFYQVPAVAWPLAVRRATLQTYSSGEVVVQQVNIATAAAAINLSFTRRSSLLPPALLDTPIADAVRRDEASQVGASYSLAVRQRFDGSTSRVLMSRASRGAAAALGTRVIITSTSIRTIIGTTDCSATLTGTRTSPSAPAWV
jgi:hypothetical protein